MKTTKRWLSLCLAGVIAVSLLGGCQKTVDNKDQSSAPISEQDNQSGQLTAMGRYVEAEIALPTHSLEGQEVLGVLKNGDGRLLAYTGIRNELEGVTALGRFMYDGSTWTEDTPDWLSKVAEAGFYKYMPKCYMGLDGAEYLVGYGAESGIRVLRSQDGVQYEELFVEILGKKVEGYDFYPSVDAFAGLADGNVLLSSHWFQTGVYSPDGKLIFPLQMSSIGMDFRADLAASAAELVIRGERGYERYSMVDGRKLEDIPVMEGEDSDYQYLVMDEEGGLYGCDRTGIHHITKGGSIWETLVDGSLNSLGIPSLYTLNFFQGERDDFYVLMNSDDTKQLLHYTYDPNMATLPANTLNVYGIRESATIQQAAALFQKSHPDVRVVVGNSGIGLGDSIEEDSIRTLNTELLSGKGADILLLDGLPVQSYIEKGVLADISDIIAPFEQKGALLKGVVDAYKQDGKLYRIPSRISLPVLIGEAAAIRATESMGAFKEYHDAGNKAAFRIMNYESLLRICTQMFYADIFNEDASFKPGALKSLLEATKAAGEKNGTQNVFEEATLGRDADYFNMVIDRGFSLADELSYLGHSTPLSISDIESDMDIMMVAEVAKQKENQFLALNQIFIPKHIVGINAASQNIEMAREFVTLLLSLEVQKDGLYDGMPVNTEAIQAWGAKGSQSSIGASTATEDGVTVELSAEWPGEEKAMEIMSLADQCTVPVDIDEVLMKMIVEEAGGYFDGEITVEQAVSAIENKASLYFAE